MESYICQPSDLVLLVGEGNFSFSRDFLEINKDNDFPSGNLYSTCYEPDCDNFSSTKLENLAALKIAGVNVLFGVDATQLSQDARLNQIPFTKFIFNFPHTGGKMKINLNRILLQQFCEQCKQMIAGNGEDFTHISSNKREYYRHCQVIIPLCKGQGGTLFDETRNWEDTWKVVEMAGHADLVLSNVEYFDTESLKYYSSIGFRSREQHFNTVRGIIHLFKLSLHPELYKYDMWVDMWPSSHIGQLMDMKQTSILTDSIFNGFKKLFIKELESSKDSSLQLETNFIVRKGFDSVAPEYSLDPNKVYDQRTFLDTFCPNSFKKHPVEYKYISYNSLFHTMCLAFLDKICERINKCGKFIGTRLPLVDTPFKQEEKFVSEHFVVHDNKSGTITIRNCVRNEEEVVFQEMRGDNSEASGSKVGSKTDLKYIFHIQKLAQFLSGSKDWRVIFSHENSISVDNDNILRFHFAQLSPIEYKFDINFTVQSEEYSLDKFFKCLWYIVPEMIQDVQLINEHQNPDQKYMSYLFRFWYKSYDRPMYRKRVIHVHQNVIGKYLHSMLGVKVD
ncbi:hypothetical protein WDU94_008592 [Cyamophila willieti]